jgi:hypothetical protein
MLTTASHQRLTVREATDHDAYALTHLAAVDSADPLPGRVLVAEIDGRPVAALSMTTSTVVADPFRRTADIVQMLKVRAAQMRGERVSRRGLPVRGPRPVPVH